MFPLFFKNVFPLGYIHNDKSSCHSLHFHLYMPLQAMFHGVLSPVEVCIIIPVYRRGSGNSERASPLPEDLWLQSAGVKVGTQVLLNSKLLLCVAFP